MAQSDLQQQLAATRRQVRLLGAELDAAKQDLARLEAEMNDQVAARVAVHEAELSHTHDLIVALGRVTAQIEAVTDIDQTLGMLGEQLKRLGIYCVVSLFDLPTQNLFIRYQSVDLQQLRHAEALAGLSMFGFQLTRENFPLFDDIINLEQPAFVADPMSLVQAVLPDVSSSFHNQLLTLVGIMADTAMVYLPLAVEKRVLGILTIWGETLQISDVQVYSIFAGQVAAVLEVGRLREQAQAQRIEEQDALLGLSQALLGLTDTAQVVRETIRVVQQLLNVDEVMLMLPDAEGVNLVEVRGEGEVERENGRFRTPISASLEGRVWQTGHTGQTAVTTATTKTSYIIIPMRSRAGIMGVLRANRFGHHDFALTETRLLSLIAHQAAQALDHTRLVEEAHRRAHEAETLYQTGAIVASTLSSDEAVDRILLQLERVVPYDSASVQLLKDDHLEIVGGRGWDNPDAIIGFRFPIPGDNPNTDVVQQRRASILHNAPETYPTFAQYPPAHTKSWLGVPLIIQDRVIGMLAVDSKKPHYFSTQNANLLMAFADQVAIAIRNAQLYEASQRQLKELKVLHAIADASVEAIRSDVILERATEILRAVFYPHVLGVLLLDEETNTLRAHASYHEKVGIVHTEVSLDRGVIGYVARTGQPKRVADVRQDPIYTVGDPQVMSELCVPIKVGTRVLGVLNTESTELNAFGPEDERFLVTIAGQLAAALERLRNEQEVRKLASAVEQTADLIYITDRDGTLKYVNPAFEVLTGYTRGEVLGKTLTALGLGWPNEQLFLDSWQASKGMQHFHGIAINRKKNGEWYYEEKTITPLRDWQDDNTLFVHAGKDITARMQREQEREAILMMATALRKAETRAEMAPVVLQQVRSLMQADGVALVIYDGATKTSVIELAIGLIATFSGRRIPDEQPSIFRYVIAHNEAVVHRPPHPLPAPSIITDLSSGIACVPLAIQQQTIGALWVSRQVVFTDDEVRWLIAIADMVANAVNRATLHEQLVTQATILEQRVAERTQELAIAYEQLQALDRLKSKFVSDVSHELRTPVHNLQLYLDLLQRGKAENAEKYQQILRQQAERLRQLIEDILDLSRLEMGRERIEFNLLSLNALVEPVVMAHQVQAQEAGLTLQFMPGTNLPQIWGERNQLAQVVTNLVTNSIKYTLTGKVIVKTYLSAAEDKVCLHVEDTGVGIDPVDRLHLFDRFYRGQHLLPRDVPGTGLGLAIVKEIVDLHSGQIELKSEVGKGSTFRVWFPLGIYEQGALDEPEQV